MRARLAESKRDPDIIHEGKTYFGSLEYEGTRREIPPRDAAQALWPTTSASGYELRPVTRAVDIAQCLFSF